MISLPDPIRDDELRKNATRREVVMSVEKGMIYFYETYEWERWDWSNVAVNVLYKIS